MVSHIEERAGKFHIQILVTRHAGMFVAEIPRSATPVELELFFTQVRSIVTRRQKEPPNEPTG